MRKTVLAIFLMGIVFAVEASAAGPAGEAMRKFGLLGSWAQDCGLPPAVANHHTTYENPSTGTATRTVRMNIPKLDGTVPIERARIIDGGRLEIFWMDRELEFQIILKMVDGRHRTLQSIASDGKTYIQDGRITGNDRKAPWFNRCQDPMM